MSAVDPFASLRDWRCSLYRGDHASVDQFLDLIDATLPADWIRDRGYEQSRARPDRIRCHLFDRAGDASVRVWLERVSATRVRGGPIEVIRHPPAGNAGRIGELVGRFAGGCVLPAAISAGVRCTRPTFGARSAISSTTEMLFTQFADAADGEWPLTAHLQELWDELISLCLREQVALDRNELTQWAIDNGWEQPAAASLVDRFFADSRWLAKQMAAIAP